MYPDPEVRAAFKLLLEKGAMGAGVLHTPDCLGFARNLRQSVVPRFTSVTYEELKSKGVVFRSAPKDQFYGIEAVVTDGVGNWFSMTQPKPMG